MSEWTREPRRGGDLRNELALSRKGGHERGSGWGVETISWQRKHPVSHFLKLEGAWHAAEAEGRPRDWSCRALVGGSGFLVAQMVKNLPAVQETWVQSLGWEDPLERAWQLSPVFLPGEVHRQRSLVGYSPWGCKESYMTELLTHTHTHTHTHTVVGWGRFILVLNATLRILNFETLLETTVSCFGKTVICSGFHTIHISAQKHKWLVATLT